MHKFMAYVSYFFYGLAVLSGVALLIAWTLDAFCYNLPVPIPDDAFEPVFGLITMVSSGLVVQPRSGDAFRRAGLQPASASFKQALRVKSMRSDH